MSIFLILMVLCYLNRSVALVAYDCMDPKINISVISIKDVAPCPNPVTDYQETPIKVTVLQKDEIKQVAVKSCLVEVTRIITYCGMHSHSSLVKKGLYSYIYQLGSDSCRDIHRYRTFSIFNRLIGQILMNGTTSESITIVGIVDSDGSCDGGSYVENGNEWNNVIVLATVKITTKNYLAPVKLIENEVSLLGGVTCPYVNGYCFDSTFGETMWDLDMGKNCEEDLTMLYKGKAQLVIEKNSAKYLVIEQNSKVFALTLVKQNEICSFTVWTTEHPQILVIDETKETFGRKYKLEHPVQNINIMMYVNSKFMYVEQAYKRSIQKLYSDTVHRRCLTHREILINRLTMAPLTPSAIGMLIQRKSGYAGRVLGEVLYIMKCVPKKVEIRRTDHCYNELPISVNNESYFMSAVTHIIQPHAEEIECNLLTPPLYQIDGQWIGLTPHPVISDPPRRIEVEPEKRLKFNPIQPISSSGVYTIEEINKAQRSLTFGIERSAVENIIARRVAGLEVNNQGYSTLSIFDKSDLEKLARSTLHKVWGWFTDIGIFFSGIMGFYVICRGLKYIIEVFINGFHLYKLVGFSFTLLASLWSTLTMWVVHHHEKQSASSKDGICRQPDPEILTEEQPLALASNSTGLYPEISHWTEKEKTSSVVSA